MLIKKSKPIAIETRPFNSINGNDAELLAGSKLVMACGAEINWGSRNEDGRKIDIILSYDHPWVDKGERMLVLVQVKSGVSYGEILTDGFILKSSAKELAIRTSHAICVVWVSRQQNKVFWAYIHPTTEISNQKYGKNHQISPATRFDLARCQAKYLPIKEGGSGIILKLLSGSLKEQRVEVIQKYRHYKDQGIQIPNLGKLEFTRIGLRHMFRKGRSIKGKTSSFTALYYLDKIITDNPSEVYIPQCEPSIIDGFEYRTSEYVLIYNKVKFFNKENGKVEPVKFICRVIEEIRWPVNWIDSSTLSQLTERRLVLLSCYYKQVN